MHASRWQATHRFLLHGLRSREGLRGIAACAAALCLLLMIVALASRGHVVARSGPPNTQPRQDVSEYRLGAIVVASWKKMCEERAFDNATGDIVGETMVDCEARLKPDIAEAAPPKHDNTVRIRGLLGSFQK